MKQKWHHITITIKLKIHTKNDCQLDFNDEDLGIRSRKYIRKYSDNAD